MAANSTNIPPSEENYLIITPNEIVFNPPLNKSSSTIVHFQNTSKKYVIFKVKTTAPKRYVVRPNTGSIPPLGQVETQVLLNIKELPENLKTKDKFQVQSLMLDESPEGHDIKELWARAPEEKIMKQRLKCYLGALTGVPSFTPTLKQIPSDSEVSISSHDQYETASHATAIIASSDEDSGHARSPLLGSSSSEHVNKEKDAEHAKIVEALRRELRTVQSDYRTVISQRDTFKLEAEKYKEIVKEERENSIRQRKQIEAIKATAASVVPTTPATTTIPRTTVTTQPQPSSDLIKLLVIAIIFFFLGYWLK